ncbi:MAG: N-acetylmuramoyl-L-alanine amidase, partial [Oscillospiraceae bacterium]|nr:N-acetylmuramoyl-L-alanine amidase [Oscillospiraceae bacterium]
MINDMWANSSSHADGSYTVDSVQAYFDGFSDTKKYVEQGYADFVMVKAYGSTSDNALHFDTVVRWWYDLAEANGAKTYVLHLNEKIGNYSGWYEDQLLRQLAVLEDYENIGGSAFNSYASLKADPLGTTTTLKKYFAEQINTETIFEDLEMVSPASHSFVTYDSTVKFMGTFDENFDVFFDGKKIELNEVGNFYFQKDLNVGWNSFVIEHKGKQQKYSIERRVDVMQSVEDGDVVVEGGTKITLSAIAYSGSAVSASIA